MKRSLGYKKFFVILFIPVLLEVLFIVALDPFFHYHAPGNSIPYLLSDERYQNDGIVKRFDYEAIISGSSETQNFSVTDFERLMGVNTVKTSFAGGSFKEVDSLIRTGLSHNNNIKCVLRSLDLNMLDMDKDYLSYDEYPEYLYDRNWVNDYKYIFNKDVFLQAGYRLVMLATHQQSTSFDEYGSFYKEHSFSKEAVLANYQRMDITGEVQKLTDETKNRVYENISQNILDTAKNNPEVTFYFFFPPYSVLFWEGAIRTGEFDAVFEKIDYTLELILNQNNIKVYGFFDCYDLVTNLDRYMDSLHYDYEAGCMILEKIANEEGILTKDNYHDYLEKVYDFYLNYDYDSMYGG